MIKRLVTVIALVAAGLVSTQQQAHAQSTTTQPEMACFVNSATLAQFTGCHFIGENVPNAVLTTLAGTYTVTCSSFGGCTFGFVARNPFRPAVLEP